jgi:hypothetical protein
MLSQFFTQVIQTTPPGLCENLMNIHFKNIPYTKINLKNMGCCVIYGIFKIYLLSHASNYTALEKSSKLIQKSLSSPLGI